MMDRPVEYEQTDARWRNVMYSNHGDPNQKIGTDGCGPTCAAMVVATLRDDKVTPVRAANWAVENGYLSYDDGTYWAYFQAYLRQYGIACQQTDNKNRAWEMLRKDRMVITSMRKGNWTSGGHFILAYGVADDGRVKIHDPNSEASYRELGDASRYLAEAAQFWIIPEVWKVQLKPLTIKDLDRNKELTVNAINVDGYNYIRLRDMEKLAPIVVGNEGSVPTIAINYKVK